MRSGLKHAYDMGAAARKWGRSIRDNPYAAHTVQWRVFRKGFHGRRTNVTIESTVTPFVRPATEVVAVAIGHNSGDCGGGCEVLEGERVSGPLVGVIAA